MKYSIMTERKIAKLLKEMTIEEKVLQLQQVAANGDSETLKSFIHRGAYHSFTFSEKIQTP